ncbi:hypothetical protein [Streptomyces marincola]|nr:hypothetical protein [Streptomyces marincola]
MRPSYAPTTGHAGRTLTPINDLAMDETDAKSSASVVEDVVVVWGTD